MLVPRRSADDLDLDIGVARALPVTRAVGPTEKLGAAAGALQTTAAAEAAETTATMTQVAGVAHASGLALKGPAAGAVDAAEAAGAASTPETPKTVQPFSEMPGPRGLAFIGTLWDYTRKDGFTFSKMFEVRADLPPCI